MRRFLLVLKRGIVISERVLITLMTNNFEGKLQTVRVEIRKGRFFI